MILELRKDKKCGYILKRKKIKVLERKKKLKQNKKGKTKINSIKEK